MAKAKIVSVQGCVDIGKQVAPPHRKDALAAAADIFAA
eukprot:gene11676-20305_t